MQMIWAVVAVIFGYVLGSVPFGLVIVKLKTGKDVRTVESGRTGGTNVARAAGFWAGFLTAIMDILKGTISVWVAQWLTPENHIVHVLAPIFAILGHNYSIFLLERDENGQVKFRGGAGGATALGGAVGLWLPIFPILFAVGAILWFSLGIASLATMGVGLAVIVIFAIRISLGVPNASIDIWYGIIAELLLVWALRPNIKKLLSGNERVIGTSLNGWLRARKEAKQQEK
jgi:glycerol-3-phosphate acyltransferase PlsY